MNSKALILSSLLVAVAMPMAAQAVDSGNKMECINLKAVDQSPVIDDHTIVFKMKTGAALYKRVDLAAPCNGITYNGFAHQTGYDELCSSSSLTSLATGGGACKISRIVDISADEAKALMTKHK